MLKKSTKITSMIVAISSVMSLSPSVSAFAATKLETIDGEIDKVVAFDSGKYLYEGYKGEDEDTALYFSKGEKADKYLEFDDEDLDDASIVERFGKDSVIIEDGSDLYRVNLTTGKVSDDDLPEDVEDDIESKIRKLTNKVDRYEDYSLDSLEKVSKDQFTDENWYMYKLTKDGEDPIFGFINEKGDYVDASYTANIQIFNGDSVKKVKEYSKSDTTKTETVVLKSIKPIAEDKNYIYTITTVEVNGAKDLDGNGLGVVSTVEGTTTTQKSDGTQYYVQKISKSTGDTEDDAKLPKNVYSYLATETISDKDAKRGFTDLFSTTGSAVELNECIGLRAIDDSLYFTTLNDDDDEVSVEKYDLKNLRVTPKDSSSKVSINTIVFDDSEEQEIKKDAGSVSIDKNGNVWAINKGKIYKSIKGGEFKQIYSVDGSLDQLEVYDDDNLIAYEYDGESFATTKGKSSSTDDDKKEEVVVNTYKVGWNQVAATGAWQYSKDGKTLITNQWVLDNGTWYFIGTDGIMKTGWLNDRGTWYYLNANGSMAHDTTINGYKLGSNGAWIR